MNDQRPEKKPRGSWGIALLGVPIVAFLAVRLWVGGPAPVPGAFDADISLATAIERSRESGRPVFAVVTADWCAPCQSYKRGALSEPSVERALRERTEAVYVDADADADAMQLLGQMGAPVAGIPATIIIRDGAVVARTEGALPADAVLQALDIAEAH